MDGWTTLEDRRLYDPVKAYAALSKVQITVVTTGRDGKHVR